MTVSSKKQKLYCYVDETGQDTRGKLFIVSVVITSDIREELAALLEKIEESSGKGKAKWVYSRQERRTAYIKAVLSNSLFKGKLLFSFYPETTKYMALTILSTARAISSVPGRLAASVYIDGLPKSRVQWFGTELRHLGVRTSKISSVRKEESNALMRLADACCGFVRQAIGGADKDIKDLFERAKRNGYIREI